MWDLFYSNFDIPLRYCDENWNMILVSKLRPHKSLYLYALKWFLGLIKGVFIFNVYTMMEDEI